MKALPVCPLCGGALVRPFGDGRSALARCQKRDCTLAQLSWFGEDEWRRLAAPPLPPEVVAVLVMADKWRDAQDFVPRIALLKAVITRWRAAGRPGLPKKTEKEK